MYMFIYEFQSFMLPSSLVVVVSYLLIIYPLPTQLVTRLRKLNSLRRVIMAL